MFSGRTPAGGLGPVVRAVMVPLGTPFVPHGGMVEVDGAQMHVAGGFDRARIERAQQRKARGA